MNSSTDQVRLGKYELLEELGSGGFGTVFKAVDTTLDRVVAPRGLYPPLLADPNFICRFIAFVSHRDGNEAGAYVMNAGGSSPRDLHQGRVSVPTSCSK